MVASTRDLAVEGDVTQLGSGMLSTWRQQDLLMCERKEGIKDGANGFGLRTYRCSCHLLPWAPTPRPVPLMPTSWAQGQITPLKLCQAAHTHSGFFAS